MNAMRNRESNEEYRVFNQIAVIQAERLNAAIDEELAIRALGIATRRKAAAVARLTALGKIGSGALNDPLLHLDRLARKLDPGPRETFMDMIEKLRPCGGSRPGDSLHEPEIAARRATEAV